ncbi:MAG: DUF6249 domain-containing protein [bacterium]
MRKFLPATILLITLAAIWAWPAAAAEPEAEPPEGAEAEKTRTKVKIITPGAAEEPCGDEDLSPLEPDSEVRKMKVMIPIFGMMVPIIFILGGAAVIVVALLMAHRAAQMRQETIQLAIKEGRELPPELFMRMRYPRHPPPLLGGLILTALGIAVSISVGVVCGPVQAVWGLIPLFIGVAILIYVPLSRKYKKEEEDR